MAKTIRDFTILKYRDFQYQFSMDDLSSGDYYIDFKLYTYNGINAVQKCNTKELAKIINKTYENCPLDKRLSAKIIASNDPELILDGVKRLNSV